MNGFEFVFPLFALLVGLSVADMLVGLARALKNKREVRVGWLTPLLGLVILLNLTMIWIGAWDMRDVATPSSTGMLFILVVGGAYFLAAAMVFPGIGAEERDLDAYFLEHRRVPLLTIARATRSTSRGWRSRIWVSSRPPGGLVTACSSRW